MINEMSINSDCQKLIIMKSTSKNQYVDVLLIYENKCYFNFLSSLVCNLRMSEIARSLRCTTTTLYYCSFNKMIQKFNNFVKAF